MSYRKFNELFKALHSSCLFFHTFSDWSGSALSLPGTESTAGTTVGTVHIPYIINSSEYMTCLLNEIFSSLRQGLLPFAAS